MAAMAPTYGLAPSVYGPDRHPGRRGGGPEAVRIEARQAPDATSVPDFRDLTTDFDDRGEPYSCAWGNTVTYDLRRCAVLLVEN